MHVILNGEPLEEVDCFKYLGSQVAADGGCVRDVVHRMNEGYRAWGALKSALSRPLLLKLFTLRSQFFPNECLDDPSVVSIIKATKFRDTLYIRDSRVPSPNPKGHHDPQLKKH